jgi:methylglyoxal synthase
MRPTPVAFHPSLILSPLPSINHDADVYHILRVSSITSAPFHMM